MAIDRCKSILVVEDDQDIRDTLGQMLELEGYEVTSAANGQEALAALERIPSPCLILLDLMMPVMNGWEFLERRKEHTAFATIPVVVVSAAGDRAQSAVASGYIKKPIDWDGLMKFVTEYCRKTD